MRVLVHMNWKMVERVRAAGLPVEVVHVPPDAPPPADVRGDILLALGWNTPHLVPLIEQANPRWIHTYSTGVDAFPVHAVGSRLFTCSRGASAVPIAEWVLAQMLAFEKRLPETWIDQPPARIYFPPTPLGALRGRSLVVIGIGGIGAAVARRALAFEMRVSAVRNSPRPSPVPGVSVAADLAAALAQADHVVLATPLTPRTRHIIDARALGAVKPGVYIVNPARGGLIEESALRAALDDGRVAGAALDAVEPEPLPAGHWMYSHPRVRLSAHVSWDAPESFDEILQPFVDNVRRYLAGEPLLGIVDKDAGY
ncbi:MAG: NAD(P)-dependent oxidoreductase [Candidatus Binatia bacterium]